MKPVQSLATASIRAAGARAAARSTVPRAQLSQLSSKAQRQSIRSKTLFRPILSSSYCQTRSFASSPSFQIVLSPTEPEAPNTESSKGEETLHAVEISDSEYHEVADQYLNTLLLRLEELADSDAQKGLEVEFSAGVLTITVPSKGDYVLNKQPPNKQIWLSSPISGPKRYDWARVQSQQGGMDTKQDSEGHSGAMGDDGELGGGKWIYLRDGSGLTQLLEDELGVVVSLQAESDATTGREGPGASGASPASTGAVEG